MTKNKRIKKVFQNIDEITDLFLNQSQYSARCRNAFYEGREIYSYGYHYLLGRFIMLNGVKVLAINSTGYSRTTRGHIYSLIAAAERLKIPYIEFNTNDSIFNSTSSTYDSAIIKMINDSLENQRNRHYDTLAHSYYDSKDSRYYFFNYDLKSISEHNETIKKYKLDSDLLVEFPQWYIDDIKIISKIVYAHRSNINSRQQGNFRPLRLVV